MSVVLDNPVWASLCGAHAGFAEGVGAARRYQPALAPFAGLRDASEGAFEDLRELLAPGQAAALFTAVAVTPPEPGVLALVRAAALLQMVAEGVPEPLGDVEALGIGDAAAMHGLAALANPGPFGPRAHEFGGFLGVWEGGTLIAMAGERMRLPGYVEVTAVSTHPGYRGRGLGRVVVGAVMRAIAARGDRPMLHVFADNAPAIGLYEALGMRTRCVMHLAVLRRLD